MRELFCTISPACLVSSVRVLEVKGRDSVGWSGKSVAAVKGTRRSMQMWSARECYRGFVSSPSSLTSAYGSNSAADIAAC